MRNPLSAIFSLCIATSAFAQDAIKVEKVPEIKASSVFIRNQTETARSSGSGFVIATVADGTLICTNAHVVTSDLGEKQTPTQMLAKVKAAKLTMVFDSGLATERSAPAEVVSIDPTTDLAILKVKSTDLKNLPKPLKIDGAKALAETAAVYSFGFPLGDRLSTGKGPAITVGKASVSSLRTDDQGKLSTIQIDGSLNPGNSGGPVVDASGTVIGVAVAIARDSQGIGFVIPVSEVQSLLAGRVAMLKAEYEKQTDGKVKVLIEAHVSNPLGKITAVNLYYAKMESGAEKLKGSSELRQLSGSKNITLKLEGSIAKGEFMLDKADGLLTYCAIPTGGSTATDPLTVVSLARTVNGKQGIDAETKPPAGWTQMFTKFGLFSAWVPEKSSKPKDLSRTLRGTTGMSVSITSVQTIGDNGLIYHLEQATVHAGAGKRIDTKVLRELIVKSMADDLKGRIVEETDAKLGDWPGKEYTIKAGAKTSILRIVAGGPFLYILHVHGATDKVTGDDGQLFLNSFRNHPKDSPDVAIGPKPGPGETTNPKPVTPKPAAPAIEGVMPKPTEASTSPFPTNVGKTKIHNTGETEIVAGGGDPIVKDYGPDGGMLVGFQVGLGKFFDDDIVVALRPIYRADGKESFGTGRGSSTNIKAVMAKEGYAVGGILVSSGLTVDGMVVVFMKIDGDKLDPKDSYQSTLIGHANKVPDRYITGDGVPLIGVAQKQNTRTSAITGFGLILNTPEAIETRRTWGRGTSTEILGGFNDPIYRDIAPEGGLLIGLEVGLKSERNMDFIRGFKPIYMTGDQESTGKQYGSPSDKTVTVKAKPGYAIAGVSMISGLRADGFSVAFLKITKNGLDQKDGYVSEWVGATEKKQPKILTGNGLPIIGITGKQNDNENTGFGLIVQTAKK